MTRILVLDDSATMRRIVRNHLQTMGFESVEEVDNGHAALAKIEAGTVDLLVSDWAMPAMSGLAVLQTIRASAKHSKLPVLMITGIGLEDDIREAVNAGVSGYILKPFDPKTLAEKVSQILSDATVKA
jgi:two-component system chemotaxis response regulator CheY